MLIAREFKKQDKIKLLDMINEINNFDSNFEGLTNISKIINYDKIFGKTRKKINIKNL